MRHLPRHRGIVAIALTIAVWTAAPAAPPVQSSNPSAIARIEHLRVDGKTINLQALPDNQILKGKSGREISVGRLKQLQAVLAGNTSIEAKPAIKIAPGQNLRAVAALPDNPRIQLANGRVVRAQQLRPIFALIDRLKGPHKSIPVQHILMGVKTNRIVGQNLTIAEVLKPEAYKGEPIRVGKYVYSAEALREIDARLRADPHDHRGLAERAAAIAKKRGNGKAELRGSGPTMNLKRVPPGTTLKSMLEQPDDTVLISPHGTKTTVGQLKAYLKQNGMSIEQVEAKYRAPIGKEGKQP